MATKGVPVRRVTSADPKWLKGGVGSADVAALVGCAFNDDGPLTLWAKIVQRQELKEIKRMRKERQTQGSPEWLDWRRKGVGGSEVACVVGANPYAGSGAMDVWRKKLPADHPEWAPETPSNAAMEYGRKNEPGARDIYESLMGWSATDVCVLHSEFDYARCSLDGLSDDGQIVLEIKCHKNPSKHQQNLEIAKITDPLERQIAYAQTHSSYRYQIIYQLELTGAKVAHFVSWKPEWKNPADRFCMFSLYPEPAEQRRLMERLTEFWDFVLRREPPPKEWLIPVHSLPSEVQVPNAVGSQP